nr:subunit 2 of NADH-plastoquinone oxidoreductase [Klebsormidium dissectum]WKT07674.1 subunit 2 of NADH-plastoquinone oxidoreductase [Klebsormidium sp. SEV1-VF17pt]
MLQFAPIVPEAILTVSLICICFVDLFQRKNPPYKKGWENVWIPSLGLALSIFALLWRLPQPPSLILGGAFAEDSLGICFRLIIAISSFISICLCFDYLQMGSVPAAEFVIFILTATIGGMLLSASNDLVLAFVAFECLSLSSYLLAGYTRKDLRSQESAAKYLILGSASSCALAYGFSWLYGLGGGSTSFQEIGFALKEYASLPLATWIAFLFVFFGIGFKLSAAPFHQWAPDVYEGSPTPSVAFLSVSSKAAGLAIAARLLWVVFPTLQPQAGQIVQVLAILSMLVGNLVAACQSHMKRMLAYSSIGQIGYLLLALSLEHGQGQNSLLLYLGTYVFMNMGAFACTIILSLQIGTDSIRSYAGLFQTKPLICASLSLCLLSLAGLPPLVGFFGKTYLFWTTWQGQLYIPTIIGVLTSALSLYYYLRVIRIMFTQETKGTLSWQQLGFTGQKRMTLALVNEKQTTPGLLAITLFLCASIVSLLSFLIGPLTNIVNSLLFFYNDGL